MCSSDLLALNLVGIPHLISNPVSSTSSFFYIHAQVPALRILSVCPSLLATLYQQASSLTSSYTLHYILRLTRGPFCYLYYPSVLLLLLLLVLL